MNRLAVSALAVFLIGILSVYARSQTRGAELEVAGVKLHLGMTKAEVMEKLAGRTYWKVNDDNWVSGPSNSVGPAMQFTNGKLTFTERFWATKDTDTAMALFGAVSSLNNDGFRKCDVTAGVNTSPDIVAHNVWISCGEKSVVVNRDTIGNHSYTMVHEELGKQHEIGN